MPKLVLNDANKNETQRSSRESINEIEDDSKMSNNKTAPKSKNLILDKIM